eukprot:TRINITY_DN65447_c0_g1_i1.p2 TRINITY_DN65447_c0_g1~~TRINITY_DN65447_c0_g1_i1.p2  ORF type:complete len:117 (+),score=19.75 TRINITY_DN65447_c0_g1_i1:124-474(+)
MASCFDDAAMAPQPTHVQVLRPDGFTEIMTMPAQHPGLPRRTADGLRNREAPTRPLATPSAKEQLLAQPLLARLRRLPLLRWCCTACRRRREALGGEDVGCRTSTPYDASWQAPSD